MGPIGRSFPEGEEHKATVVDGWEHVMVYCFVPIEQGLALPQKLHHVLIFEAGSEDDRYTQDVDMGTAVLPRSETMRIGPPLTGGPWVALNGPGNASGHRRMPLPLDGRPALAQRYAIDYMMIDADGRFYSGDKTKNEDYPTFGREVIAVADGVISTSFDEVPENTPYVTSRPEVFTLTTAIGNHVILDLGDGIYVLYAHLKRGSVRVKEGDFVRRVMCWVSSATPATRVAPTSTSTSSMRTSRWGPRVCPTSTPPSSGSAAVTADRSAVSAR
jgi:hypothetical protein